MIVSTIHKGCPICRSDVKGNVRSGYYCKRCNLNFPSNSIDTKRRIKRVRKNIRRRFYKKDEKKHKL